MSSERTLDSKLPNTPFLLSELHRLGSKTEDSLNDSKKQRELHPMIWLAYWRDGMGQVKVRIENEVMAEDALKKATGIDGNL